MKRGECSSDLVARSRQRTLTRDERVRLDAHLDGCAECRLELQLGADFDAVAGVRPGDDVLDAQLADAVMHRTSGGRRSRRVAVVPLAAAAACLLMGAAAMAGVARGWTRRSNAIVAVRVESAAARGAEVSGHVGASLAEAPIEAPSAPASPGEAALAQAPLTAPETPRTKGVRHPPNAALRTLAGAHAEDETAASLFQGANDERRRGHLTTAISLYDELERRFPQSEEARTSHVSLGRLLLDRGLVADALPQLDDYLASNPAGTLAPEALFGKARALEALGRRDEAGRAWGRLLASYPDSVYAAQARQRIDALR